MLRRILFVAAIVVVAPAWNFDWAGHVEVDAEGLQSDDPAKRHDAVGDLGKYDISLTEKHLMQALADPDEKVRIAAAKALGSGGSQAAVPTMIEWLTDVDPKIQQVAAAALGDIGGPEAAAALTRSLSAPDDVVRQQVVKALGAIGRRGNPNVVIALIPRLEDGKADVRITTINQLEELGDRRAVIPLVARFGDTALEARKAAVRAIGKLGDRAAVPALIRLLGDPHEDVKSAAVVALGTLGAVDAVDALTERLTDSNEAFRTKVAYALGQIAGTPGAGKAGEEAMKALVANLAQPQLRQAAREALRVAGKAAVPALVAHLQGKLPGEPGTAVELLRDSADPRATAVLTAELERGRVPVPNVLRALGATGDPAALVPVLRALSSKDPAIRLEAMTSLRPLITADARAGDVLVEHLADDDLEIRVLAAEYLGILRIGAAVPKLTALAGAGNPTRLRLAAIDALGGIGRPEGTKALVAVLREGPTELHKAAATALAYIADPAAIEALIQQARTDRGPTRHEVVRALGATLRGNAGGHAATARKVLRELAQDGSVKVSLAAIAGLAAARSADDAGFLRGLVEQASSDRRRAAAWALGELRDAGSIDVLAAAMSSRDDRLVGDAAWALGEILAANPRHARAATVVDRWLHAGKQAGWAGATNAAAGLARLVWALPRDARSTLFDGARRKAFDGLVFHKTRLVRINIAHALGALPGDAGAARHLAQLLANDVSPQVRIAAATALARHGAAAVGPLKTAAQNDSDPAVREIARTLQTAVPAIPQRTEWRNYYVVDPGADDAPVRQEPYFVHAPDGLVWAAYTDARGELATEHAPPGDAKVIAATRESEY